MEEVLECVMEFQRQDDLNLRNDFINQYKPFIINTVSKCTGRYVSSVDSDEFSIGLEAFNEAINKYKQDKGNFISFAGLVIRSRVTDFLRKENKFYGHVETNEQILSELTTRVDEDLAAEVRSFKNALESFSVTIEMLVEEAPKHNKTKREVVSLGENIACNDGLSSQLYKTKKLPMAAIMNVYETTKKRLKTYRNYLIGIVVIFKEELNIMKTYLAVRGDYDASGNHH